MATGEPHAVTPRGMSDSPASPFSTVVGRPVDATNGDAAIGYRFLLGSGLSTLALIDALQHAELWGVALPDALVARGHMDEPSYAAHVAAALGLPLAGAFNVVKGPALLQLGRYSVYRVQSTGGVPTCVVPAALGSLDQVHSVAQGLLSAGISPVLAARGAIDVAVGKANRASALRDATKGLLDTKPEFSSALSPPLGQRLAMVVLSGLFIGSFMVAPGFSIAALLAILSVAFMCIVLVRLVAVFAVTRPDSHDVRVDHRTLVPSSLPYYTVMVPLYDEADVVDDLINSLSRLDYPAAKLEIILVLEEADLATKIALLQPQLARTFRTIVVPDALPRTKPKALNYALQFARGDLVVVYDAEDRPEADQLLKAVAAFRSGPPSLACVQAQLNVYNPTDSWFSRQFTVEYSALFDAILPALDALRLPIPLGGTSNHFPCAILKAIGGWDPFNVTEDADLGIRLARLGYTTEMLASTTWEEAPITWSQWKPQRTRWLKGWYQTYLVHTRRPIALLRDLGPWRTFGFHLFLGGIILSTLIHPFFYMLLIWSAVAGDSDYAIPALIDDTVMGPIALATLGLGYGSAILVGIIAVRWRGFKLTRAALVVPFTWLLVSYAAYRALWQLVRDPFLWEKTAHGLARKRSPRKP